jgi:hypothetical protein
MLAGGQTRAAHMGQTDPPRKSFLPLEEIFFSSVVYVTLTATFLRSKLRRFDDTSPTF